MHLVIVTSLDALSRNSAVLELSAHRPGTPVVLHDLLDDGLVTRRVHIDSELTERGSSVLEHGCLSCTVRFELGPTLLRLAAAGATHAIVGLPPGTTAENAVDGLFTIAPETFVVDTVALSVCAEDVEDQLWDHHTLFASGYTAVPGDSLTPGEFLIGEFLFSDTVLTTTSELLPGDPALSDRGIALIGELAPHTRISPVVPGSAAAPALGHHDHAAARERSSPGTVTVRPTASTPFRTIEHRIDRPLHPDRFRTALGTIAQGCCYVRGSVWIAGILDTRVALHGAGPRIALGDGGTWGAGTAHGEGYRGTHIALTGDDMDDSDIARLLDACALTDDELRTSPATFRRPASHH
ncbi:hypothetical protein AC792_01630 [Arthrobacter sp. RIT-PI-e]|uniref:GTP-binding protein n=1 Tax=Arthrobacter sp. RIT-PI-e TaxID=1681197 RepID=UPI0006760C48|nr:GTP-binding protein [Arthrobacter sp. RIT-PI-e]KNC20203.1 hypothetical protein AC792_01630 [Arthrobacter sp. RIT-PI-e]